MFERLAINGREFEEKTLEHVSEYADAGLRTLILAYRELDEEEYNEFDKKFSEAKISITMDHESLIEEISEKIERNLILLGATAVEDKLQNGVTKKTISHAKINIYQLDQDLKLCLTILFFC